MCKKQRHNRESVLTLGAGFAVAAWLKVPHELFMWFVIGLSALSGVYIAGVAKEGTTTVITPTTRTTTVVADPPA